ncbi:hypothetical protein [Pseudonocardia sp.]|uniref:hypothetical protein n=1 Tax=Pseudonocardia sp. TaxID=60912 RepID=UPI0026352D5A|nr:hypothetical protein [Pseudonocardia sp.]
MIRETCDVGDGLGPVPVAELAQHAADVMRGGLAADEQPLGTRCITSCSRLSSAPLRGTLRRATPGDRSRAAAVSASTVAPTRSNSANAAPASAIASCGELGACARAEARFTCPASSGSPSQVKIAHAVWKVTCGLRTGGRTRSLALIAHPTENSPR